MIGVNNGTALHRAAWAGDLPMVQRLVAKGADVNNRDNPFAGTPMGWASYNRQPHVVEWLQQHAAIDLHDAVFFDLREQRPGSPARRSGGGQHALDDGEIPQGTPLHAAARLNREPAAEDPPGVRRGSQHPGGQRTHAARYRRPARRHRRRRAARAARRHADDRGYEGVHASEGEAVRESREGRSRRVPVWRRPGAAARPGVFQPRGHPFRAAQGRADRLHKGKDADISLAEARDVVAGLRGFSSWAALAESVTRPDDRSGGWAMPPYRIDETRNTLEVRRSLEAERLAHHRPGDGRSQADRARCQWADDGRGARAHRRAQSGHDAQLGGSNALTDAGLRHLARMPQLQELDLSGWEMQITDRGLEALRHLTALRKFQMCWPQRVTDAGVANLAILRSPRAAWI